MADKEAAVRVQPHSLSTDDESNTSAIPSHAHDGNRLHFAQRGTNVDIDVVPGAGENNVGGNDSDIDGYDAARMRARSALTTDEEKKLMRRVDVRMMTLCSLIFLIKNLDANNLSNARIMNAGTPRNIMTQLGLTSDEYTLLTALYYIPYIVFEAPSNLLLKRARPSVWQSRIIISWGIALLCHVPVHNKGGIYATRFLLGLFEAGMFPGVILQMTYWYRPDEMSIRLLYFYCLGNFSGVISGILAYGFNYTSGHGGLSGWQWLFLTEGLLTITIGVAIFFFLPDFPPTAKWLTEKEKAFIQARLPPNAPRADELNFNWRELVAALKDKRLWLFTLIWATFTVGTSGVAFFQPTVIANLGYTTVARAQLLNLPVSILSIALIALTGYFADTFSRLPRPVYPLCVYAVVLISYGVMVAYPSDGAVYAATVIGNSAAATFYPLMWPWRVQTTAHATGSAFSIGFVNSYGQIGGAIGPQIFRAKYGPRYKESFTAAMACVAAGVVVTCITWWVTRRTERDTRMLKRARMQASKKGMTVLEDVVDKDLASGTKSSDDERR